MKPAVIVTASLLFLIFVFPYCEIRGISGSHVLKSGWMFFADEPYGGPFPKQVVWETMLIEIVAAFAVGAVVWAVTNKKWNVPPPPPPPPPPAP